MASSMPFGLSYNEAANPRAAPLQAWITAAATTGTCKYSHNFTLPSRARGEKNQKQKNVSINTEPQITSSL